MVGAEGRRGGGECGGCRCWLSVCKSKSLFLLFIGGKALRRPEGQPAAKSPLSEGAPAGVHHVRASLRGDTATPAGEARGDCHPASASVRFSQTEGLACVLTSIGGDVTLPDQSSGVVGAPGTRARAWPGVKNIEGKGSGARLDVGKEDAA